MPQRVKKSRFTSRLENKGGQAIIEYVLILVVSVSLIIGLMNVTLKPFGEFISNYMGKYTGCLLEYGELPSLDSETPSTVDEDSECNKKFQPGTLAAGRPPSNTSSSSSDSSSRSRAPSSSSTPERARSSGGGTYAGSASRGAEGSAGSRRKPTSGLDGRSSAPGGKIVEIALDGGANDGFFKSNGNARSLAQTRKSNSVAITGVTEEERKKLERNANGGSRLQAGEGVKPAVKKMAVKKPASVSVLEADEPMTIGNFIRYLLIAALILALVVFLGGQALQFSKSD